MKVPRCVLCVVVAGCSTDADGPPIDPANTCIVRVEDRFLREDFVYELVSPGRPTNQKVYRDGVVGSYWEYTHDDAGRLVTEDQDCCGGMPAGPDGIFDVKVRYEHTATSSITRHFEREGDAVRSSSEMTVDALDRITRVTYGEGAETTGGGAVDFVLNDDGTVARREVNGNDIDLGPYTSIDTYRYEAGRLVEHAGSDTRSSGMSQVSFVYESQPERLVVTRTSISGNGSQTTYHYGSDGRLTRIEADEDLSGSIDVITDFAYVDGVTATMMRLSSSSPRTYAYSPACAFQPTAPKMPTSGTRPGLNWGPMHYPFLLGPLE